MMDWNVGFCVGMSGSDGALRREVLIPVNKRSCLMSSAIEFLEKAGASALFGSFSEREYQAMVASLDVDASHRRSLQTKDASGLALSLCGRDQMICMIAIPEEDDLDSEDRD